MSVVPFPLPPPRPGNGAREAVIKIIEDRTVALEVGPFDAPTIADYILALLWEAGFKVAPCGAPTPNDPAA